MSEKSRYHHGNLRAALMQGATQFIRLHGAEKLSLRALAREVGVSQAAPYRHFQDKVALLSALASDGFERLGERMRATFELHQQDPQSALREVGEEYVRFALSNPEIYRLMFGMKASEFDASEMQVGHTEGYCILEQVIERGLEMGMFQQHDADMIAKTAWSMVHGYSSLLIDGVLELDETTALSQFQQMAAVWFNGVVNSR